MCNKKENTVEAYNKKQEYENSNHISIDFDGVIHKNSKGFFDGTIYDEPIDGSLDAIKKIHRLGYKIIIFTAKAKKDRPLIGGKSGEKLVWDWLKKHNIDYYIYKVTSEKPRSFLYIDDKGYRFENWSDTILFLDSIKK